MRWLCLLVIGSVGWPVMGLAQDDAFCALNCRASVPRGGALAYQACIALVCQPDAVQGPAWQAGRMQDPTHGGYASVSSDDSAQQLILTCESRGPMSILLRSGTVDRGEVQWIVDGRSVEWLEMEQRGGVLAAEIPRASRLVIALQDGGQVTALSGDGRARADFGLRGSDRAIRAAMGYCMER